MIKKEIGIGFLVGVIANMFGIIISIFIFSALSKNGLTFEETINGAIKNDSIGSIIALGAILNLIAFFLFLKQNRNYRARGVLLATFIAAIAIMISKIM